jgi:hypothetical protein
MLQIVRITMKTKLITALRTCANALEQGTFAYEWQHPQSCNCGIVACALMGKSVAEMAALIAPMRAHVERPNWKFMVGKFCPVTGMPENEVFRALIGAGMSQADIIELEELGNEKVLERINLKDVYAVETVPLTMMEKLRHKQPRTVRKRTAHYVSKQNAIAYMRAWADILTEEGAMDVAPQEPKEVKAA